MTITDTTPAVAPDPVRPGPTCQIEEITPELARKWLAKNHANRRLMNSNVERLKAIIARGEWMPDSTDGIGLDTDDGVVNGQHRLTAIAEGEMMVRALVVRNVRPEVIKVIDQGLPRNLAQILQMDGRYDYPVDLAGAITWLWRISEGLEKSLPVAMKPSVPQLLEFFGEHPHLKDSMPAAVDAARPFKGVQRSWLCAFHYLMATVDSDAADDFFAALESGTSLRPGSPVLILREKIIANQTATKQEPGTVVAAWLVKAWEAERQGSTFANKAALKWKPTGARAEEFPRISGLVLEGFADHEAEGGAEQDDYEDTELSFEDSDES